MAADQCPGENGIHRELSKILYGQLPLGTVTGSVP